MPALEQRVGIAQAMLHNPEVLILDEPTSGLDPNQIIEIRDLIKKFGKEKTIILAEAKKGSDLTRGNGEAEAIKIYASSFGRDPEFADFYRSMIAYKTAFQPEKTKMIISPDSEFFKYFNSAK